MECDNPAALTVTAEPRDERHYMYVLYYGHTPHAIPFIHSFG